MRDKDSADFDLEAFVDLFDTAMTSDNPAVKKAFKNLMLIAAIVNSENKDEAIRQGPMRRLVEDQKNIIRRLNELEDQQRMRGGYTITPAPMPSYPTNPTWTAPNTNTPWPTTGHPPNWPPGTVTCSSDIAMQVFDKLESKTLGNK
jgi:hypothetical protein